MLLLFIGGLTLLAPVGRAQVIPAQSTPMYSTYELEGLRTELLSTFSAYVDYFAIIDNQVEIAVLMDGMKAVESLNDTELSTLMGGKDKLGVLRLAIEDHRDAIISRLNTTMMSQGYASLDGSGFPDLPTEIANGTPTGCLIPSLTPEELLGANLIFSYAQGVQSVFNRACDLVVAGFNTSVICIITDIIFTAADFIKENISSCDGFVDSTVLVTNFKALSFIHGELSAGNSQLTTEVELLTDQVELLRQEIDGLRVANCEIIRLLNTPPKKRASVCPTCTDQPGFPYEYAQKKK